MDGNAFQAAFGNGMHDACMATLFSRQNCLFCRARIGPAGGEARAGMPCFTVHDHVDCLNCRTAWAKCAADSEPVLIAVSLSRGENLAFGAGKIPNGSDICSSGHEARIADFFLPYGLEVLLNGVAQCLLDAEEDAVSEFPDGSVPVRARHRRDAKSMRYGAFLPKKGATVHRISRLGGSSDMGLWTGRLRYTVGTDGKPMIYCLRSEALYTPRFSTILERTDKL